VETGYQPTLYYYNPNIHPYQEYQNRREGLVQLAKIRNLPVLVEPGYELEEFLARVASEPAGRCRHCYQIRLNRTAAKARELGFSIFSTTLLISPYQNQELLIRLGHEIAEVYGLQFLPVDLRPGFYESQRMAKELGLYRQKYCGCIYSEKERFYKKEK
jgi:predicted adenine nucleotide alpha hydrolase (AANH) superfamily ATPase